MVQKAGGGNVFCFLGGRGEIKFSGKNAKLFRSVNSDLDWIRQQKDTQMPKGVSDHVFNFPGIYGAENVVNTNFNTVCCNLLYNVLHA